MRVKGGLVTLIYKKALVMSNGEKAGRSTGDIVNLQSVDAVRIADLAQYGHMAWSGPWQITLAFVSLYNLVGWQAFMGVAVMVISVSRVNISVLTTSCPSTLLSQSLSRTTSRNS